MTELCGNIAENIQEIESNIDKAARRSGRTASDITLIAVTKTVSIDKIKQAIQGKLVNFGENRVQELLEKHDKFDEVYNWHIIGHLQTNKVKYIVDKVKMIHSVDSIELAREIDKRAYMAGRVCDILVQVNVAREKSKYGIFSEEVMDFIKKISQLRSVKVKGLMTIAPFCEDKEVIRSVFKGLRKIFIDIEKENIDNIDMTFLSMGMSNDYIIAIEEGSNMVRIGTSIFGER
jgi:pyridoxal phosphate enzyme (YggS family)